MPGAVGGARGGRGLALQLPRAKGDASPRPHPPARERERLRRSEREIGPAEEDGEQPGGCGQGLLSGRQHRILAGRRSPPCRQGREGGGRRWRRHPRLYRSHRTGVCWLPAPHRSLVWGQRPAGALLIPPQQAPCRRRCSGAASRPRLARGPFRAPGPSPRRGADLVQPGAGARNKPCPL